MHMLIQVPVARSEDLQTPIDNAYRTESRHDRTFMSDSKRETNALFVAIHDAPHAGDR